ncbi:MAG: T9SS type A sorting domain-containing protein, partial [candidate division WOR-3 bacterium]
NAVALYKNSSSYSMCRGVAIYYPSSTSSYNNAYINLPVASITQWDEYLRGNIDYSVSQTPYSWITTSTPTGITGDDQSKVFSLPFSFSFYGKSYNSVNICSNGFLSFTSTSTAYNPATIPNTAEPNALIAPFWRDLNPAGGGSITYYSGSDKFVVSWNAVKNFSNSNTQTFEVILYPNGEIVFQYKSVTNDVTTSIGIENQLGSSGKSINPPANSTAWKFSPSFIYMPAPPLDEMTRTSNGEGSERNLIVYPNPAKGRIHFTYRIIKKSWATIKIYNEIGQVVKTILNKECEPGIYTSEWTDEGLPSGAYFYRFHTDSDETCGKFLFLK